jgi:hypothetical protein
MVLSSDDSSKEASRLQKKTGRGIIFNVGTNKAPRWRVTEKAFSTEVLCPIPRLIDETGLHLEVLSMLAAIDQMNRLLERREASKRTL